MIVNIICAIIMIIINIALKKHTDKVYEKMIIPRTEYSYWRDIEFKNLTPVEAGLLSGKEKIGENTFVSILFELERQNIINIELIDKKYYISLKCRELEQINALKKYETKIIKLLFKNASDDSKMELSKVIENINKNISYKVYLKEIYRGIKFNILEKYYHSYINIGVNSFIKVLPLFFLLINCFNIFSTSFLFSGAMRDLLDTELFAYAVSVNIIGAILIIFEIFLFIKLIKTYYVKDEYLDEVGKLRGLYNYIVDFSTINEREVTHYELYERYYTYAVSMGIADKLEKELGQDTISSNIQSDLRFLLAYNSIIKSNTGNNKKKEKVLKLSFTVKEKLAILCFILVLIFASVLGIEMMETDLVGGMVMLLPMIFVITVVSFCTIYTRKQRIIGKVQRKIDRWK